MWGMQREREVRPMVVWSDIGDHPLIRDIRQNPYFALRAPSRRLGECTESGFLYENSHKCDFRLSPTKRGRKVDLTRTIPFVLVIDWNLRMHNLENFIKHGWSLR